MHGIKVHKKDAETVKQLLIKKHILNNDYDVMKQKEYLIFPVTKKVTIQNAESVDEVFDQKEEMLTMHDILKDEIPSEALTHLPTAFDVVGDIAIINLPEQLHRFKEKIGDAMIKCYPNVLTVVMKAGIHQGEFRLQKTEHIAGAHKKVTTHKESGVLLELHIDDVYFSVRMANERLRVASCVLPHESVLVMFSGCAPYPLVIEKHSEADKIVGIEKNPIAHDFAALNIDKNKAKHITLYKGDVREIMPTLKENFDRIVMALPKGAEDFLELALTACHDRTIIHLYDFLQLDDFPDATIENIKAACATSGWNYEVINTVLCGQYAPYTYRICIDVVVTKKDT